MKHPTIPTNHPHTQIIIMFSVTIAEPICFCKQKKKSISLTDIIEDVAAVAAQFVVCSSFSADMTR
jgi:hypothetical protein